MGRVVGGGLLRILLTLYSAGNAVVLKPSEVSDHMADLLSTLIPKYMDKVRRPLELMDDSAGVKSSNPGRQWIITANGRSPAPKPG